MFINTDYNKRPQKSRLHLAKPNKQIISHISEKFNDSLSIKLGNINELSFSIPFQVEDVNGNLIKNKHIDSIKEKMLIRIKLGTYKEWYIVDSIEEDAEDTDTFNVTAFSLGYELKNKRISGFETESMSAKEIIETLLDGTIWQVGYIDPIFTSSYRSFESGDDSNVLDCIIQWAETFGGLLVWDSENRKVSLEKANDETKQFRGFTVSYGRLIKSVKRTRTTDEMVTRLYVYGSEDLTIHSVNPTGQGYIEDYSYFMYPFKRDSNKNVIQSSYFMSDDLCNALLDHQALVAANAPQIKNISNDLADKQTKLIDEQSKLDTLKSELTNIIQLLDLANATEDQELITKRRKEKTAKESEVQSQEIVVNSLKSEINSLQNQLDKLQDEISQQASFTPELIQELDYFVIESSWRDDNYINAQELYDDAVEYFKELREPKVVIEIDIDNLLNIVEEQYYWDKLVLGELIKVKYPQMNIEYMAKIIEINYDLENGEATLTIANTKELLSDTEKLVQLLYNSSSTASLVENNKYKWNKVNAVSKQVSNLLTSEWDATKNKIIAGVNNSVEVGNRGIIIRNPDFPNEIVIMQAGVIALSQDGGENWKTAIKPDGIVAERLIGQIIAGQELMITNSSGSFTLDNNGAVFDVEHFVLRSGQSGNLVDRWQNDSDFIDEYRDDNLITAYEKKMIRREWDELKPEYDANIVKIANYYDGAGDTLAFVTNYKNAYSSLYDYLFVTPMPDKPMLTSDNMAYTTRIDSAEFNTKFRTYYNALAELEKQLDIRAKQIADDAKQIAQDAQGNIDDVKNNIAYKIEVISSNGWMFLNGQTVTEISAVVYKGKDNITSTLSPSNFIWTKTDKDGNVDTDWGAAHKSIGSKISITREDVLQKATFKCDIDI